MISGLRYEAQKKKEAAERARLLAVAEGDAGAAADPSTEVPISPVPARVADDEDADDQP